MSSIQLNTTQGIRKAYQKLIFNSLSLLNFKPNPEKNYVVGIQGGYFLPNFSIQRKTIDQIHPRSNVAILGNKDSDFHFVSYLAGIVPHKRYAEESMRKGGQGANCLQPGRHFYSVGWHKQGTPTGHPCLRMVKPSPIRRTSDNHYYDNYDPVTFENPIDNIHAGWNSNASHAFYASAGCQTISGYPKCQKNQGSGQWIEFWDVITKTNQKDWEYFLIPASTMSRVMEKELLSNSTYFPPLIYGSFSELNLKIKSILSQLYPQIKQVNSNEYDWPMLQAVLKFQEDHYGRSGADGIVGPLTLQELGL